MGTEIIETITAVAVKSSVVQNITENHKSNDEVNNKNEKTEKNKSLSRSSSTNSSELELGTNLNENQKNVFVSLLTRFLRYLIHLFRKIFKF